MEPAYSFSIPSIDDDTPLDCRIYHPKNIHSLLGDDVKGAVVAHPYPPLGGCYDDSVVLAVTETLLEQGFVVGTFNFRGAGGSDGRTSWSGKAEQDDYSSVAGFFAYYLHNLRRVDDTHRLETIPSAGGQLDTNLEKASSKPMNMMLAGYSYGALILARLQPMSNIIQRLESAEMGTAGAELILRAKTLAKQTRHSLEELQSPSSPRGRQELRSHDATTSPTPRIGASPITMGGEETDPSTRRRSRDSRRSTDFVRKSAEMPHRLRAHMKRPSMPDSVHERPEDGSMSPNPVTTEMRPVVRTRYLVISPVLLPFTHTLCPPGPPSMLPPLKRPGNTDGHAGALFAQNPTLVLFGSTEAFTSAKRLKGWAQKVQDGASSSFEWHEIESAGHFWREAGVVQALQEKVARWVESW